MEVSKEDIRNLKILYKKISDVELTDDEFIEKANELLNLYRELVMPDSDKCYKDVI